MGVPYIDTKKNQDVAFVQTVQEILKGFTKKERKIAKLAC